MKKGRDIMPINESKPSLKRTRHRNEKSLLQRNQATSPDLHSSIMQFQKANGNRATEQWVKSGFQGRANSTVQMKRQDMVNVDTDVAQLRGENPHGQAGEHDGWELTAHHIVAHSALTGALKKLKLKEKEEEDKEKSEKEQGVDYKGDTPYTNVLIHAIPDVLTKKMLDILKVNIEDSDKARKDYRGILIDKSRRNDENVNDVNLGDVREAFFEWQGGNQYMGPNTSIRAEPTGNKDDIDFDGRYFSSLDDKFDTLTELGGKLGQDSEKDNIESNLKAILDITKNVVPDVFDSSKWTEVGSLDTLEKLSIDKGLNRSHMLKYSFFKLGLNEIGPGNKYTDIVYSSGDYEYKKNKTGMQVKGTSGFIPIANAKTITPKSVTLTPLLTLLKGEGVDVTEKGDQYIIPLGGSVEMIKGNKRFRVVGYKETIPCSVVDEKNIEVSKNEVDNKEIKVETPSKSLYAYCKDSGMATSSYLPKALYDKFVSG
jgi:hypothetical protein